MLSDPMRMGGKRVDGKGFHVSIR